jgi:hypothetical protein
VATWFGITTPVTEQTLPADTRTGEQLYTVTNESGGLIQGNAFIVPEGETKVEWFGILNASRTYSADGTEQVSVAIKVPVDVAAGVYSYRFRVVLGGGVPEEQFNDGPRSRVTVLPIAVPPPAPKPFPWWIVAVAAVLIVLVGGGIVWALRPTSPPTPTLTPTQQPTPVPPPPQHKLIVDQLVMMKADTFLDADTGIVASDETRDDDLFFQGSNDPQLLAPLSRALIGVYGTDSPDEEGCARAELPRDGIPLDRLDLGVYLCLRTSLGAFSELRLVGIPGTRDSTDLLEMQVRTWQP